MRKILIATLVAAPLAGVAAYAFASGDSATGEGGIGVGAPALSLAAPDAGGPALHKRLSIKGVAIEDDDEGDELEAGEDGE